MLPNQLALVSLTPQVDLGELAVVSAAIQKQLTRDFGPIWNVDATIDPFATVADVPLGYWKILIVDTFDKGGQHKDRNNQPFALVAAGTSWSLVASHEALEMLVDPFGNKMVAGDSPVASQGRVEFLVEVCDPCQGDESAYTVNGVLVSDFYTRNYFDPVRADGVRYSFSGKIPGPRQILSGGYLTWRVPATGEWFQHNQFGGSASLKSLGVLTPANQSIRAMIDERTPETKSLANLPGDRLSMRRALRKRQSAKVATEAAAADWTACLREIEGERRDE